VYALAVACDAPRVPAPTLSTLFAALGSPEAARTITAYCEGGPAAVGEFFAAILASNRLGMARGRSSRAIENDEHECLMQLVAAHPQEFLKEVRARPAMIDRLGVVGAVATVPGDDAAQLLFAALRHRKGTIRWPALYALLRRGQAEVAPQLARLLRDRDGAVRSTAVEGLRRWGTASDLPALVTYTARVRLHDLDDALDAIETICARDHQPLPAPHPGPRLEVVTARGRAVIDIPRSVLVTTGQPLGTVDDEPLLAPCDGSVVAVDREPGQVRVTLRRLLR
jgi:hypothetical protein